MISYQWIKGNKVIAVVDYLEGEKYNDNTYETSTKEYYDSEGGKVFETMSTQMKEYLEKNNAKSDLDKLSLLKGKSRIGLDMTYSFNKDISALALVFDDKVKYTIREEMKKLMQRINDEYIETRNYDDNKNRIREKASALIQTYEHHTSRELDLDLHYHNFISNQVIRLSDSKLTSLSNERLLENTNLLRIETNYQIAYRLQHEHGYDAYLNNAGNLRVLDDDRLIEKFSKRKQAILELAKQKYNTDDLSKLNRGQIKELVLATRKSKRKADFKSLQDLWREELKELGYDEKTFLKAIKHNRSNLLSKEDYERAFNIVLKRYDNLEGIFDKNKMYRDYLIMLSEVAKEKQALLPKLEKAREMYHQLIKENELAIFKDDREREYLATREYLRIEQEALKIYKRLATQQKELFTEEEIERHIKMFEEREGYELSRDQRDVLSKLNFGLTLINGHAGAGKTTSLQVLKQIADEKKVKLYGLTPSGKAGEELAKVIGDGRTIDSFLIEISKMDYREIKQKYQNSIIVVDEVGMVDTRKIKEILEFAEKYDVKLILQGDYKQIKSVQAGDFLKDAVELARKDDNLRKSFAELTSIRRQKREEYLEITKALSNRDYQRAFEIMINNKDQYFSELDINRIKEDFLNEISDSLIVASTNNLKDELNKAIRDEMKKLKIVKKEISVYTANTFEIRHIEDVRINDVIKLNKKTYKVADIDRRTNKLKLEYQYYDRKNNKYIKELKEANLTDLIGKQATRYGIKEFGINDRIITTRNDKNMNVKNGEIFNIIDIKGNKLVLANKNKTVEIDINKYNHLDYSYAITTHKSQGMTVRNVLIVDASHNLNANLFYVATTRGKENMRIYTNDIVATLSSAQKEQVKKTSSQFKRKNKSNEKQLTKSEIAEMIILKEYGSQEAQQQYMKYVDNYRDLMRKIEAQQQRQQQHYRDKIKYREVEVAKMEHVQENRLKALLERLKREEEEKEQKRKQEQEQIRQQEQQEKEREREEQEREEKRKRGMWLER